MSHVLGFCSKDTCLLEARVKDLTAALEAVLKEEMIYTGAITETLEASGQYPELLAQIRAAMQQTK